VTTTDRGFLLMRKATAKREAAVPAATDPGKAVHSIGPRRPDAKAA
jgi:hypothetical protein